VSALGQAISSTKSPHGQT